MVHFLAAGIQLVDFMLLVVPTQCQQLHAIDVGNNEGAPVKIISSRPLCEIYEFVKSTKGICQDYTNTVQGH
jgi:hypothetical protein